jgi:asparagine synthase (glutamine-hydrolysing)
MCGICGIVNLTTEQVDRSQLEQMNLAIQHRGPDGDGFYIAAGVGLAMRRLAIIDLNTGDQPISNEDGTVWIVFNGEIFNFPKLRADLESRGHQFSTQTDTECILHLYEDYGDDCIQHLRGQFAFALWDEKRQRLLLARDRMGQKPIYYTQQNGTLYFSSELPSLLTALPTHPPIHLPAIDLYLSLQYIPEPFTPYVDIQKLPAAHKLTFKCDTVERINVERYWHYEYEPKWTASEDDLIAELRELLAAATRMRMISDVPLGAHLSGGIDSSIIVALMAAASNQPVKTFSVGFEETSFSELPYARAVAERYGTDHHEFVLTFGDIPATAETLLAHFGEPFADPSALPLYHLSNLTRQHVTVALNGDGGDEAFAGYWRYWLDPWANFYTRFPQLLTHKMIPGFMRLFSDRANRPTGGSLVNGLKRLEQLTQIDERASILRWGSYFSPAMKSQLWQNSIQDEAENLLVKTFQNARAESFMDRTLFTDNHIYLPGDLLVKADRMTMAASLEGRSPFLDHDLVAWAAHLPQNMKVRGRTGKYLLRKAFAAEMPPTIKSRGKQGFGIPLGAWFRGDLSGWAREILTDPDNPVQTWFNPPALETLLAEHHAGRSDHGKRLWALVMLALWARDQKI